MLLNIPPPLFLVAASAPLVTVFPTPLLAASVAPFAASLAPFATSLVPFVTSLVPFATSLVPFVAAGAPLPDAASVPLFAAFLLFLAASSAAFLDSLAA